MRGYGWRGGEDSRDRGGSIDYLRDLCEEMSNSENVSNSRYATLYFIMYGWEHPYEVIA